MKIGLCMLSVLRENESVWEVYGIYRKIDIYLDLQHGHLQIYNSAGSAFIKSSTNIIAPSKYSQ